MEIFVNLVMLIFFIDNFNRRTNIRLHGGNDNDWLQNPANTTGHFTSYCCRYIPYLATISTLFVP